MVRSSEANLSWQGTWEILLTLAVLTSELERWCLVNYRRTNRDCGMILSIKIRLVNLLIANECYSRSSPKSILHCTMSLEFWLSECPRFFFTSPSKAFWLIYLINFLVVALQRDSLSKTVHSWKQHFSISLGQRTSHFWPIGTVYKRFLCWC